MRLWVETWKRAEPELEAIRRREIAEMDNVMVLAQLEDAFNHAIRTFPPRQSSGLVDLHRYLEELERKRRSQEL